ncbi:dihydrolipoamide dehydrogenase [Staphylococcus gallinarum]|uniref:Dihydrolipoamide dehydrogenase n=1 Tax=Staphylococcus gallinarum TaxID=1293 RepID=A0A380FGA2_STAGA|nr:dihydrolipoamide dehydrogenase [Staphylococcus gallinarum]
MKKELTARGVQFFENTHLTENDVKVMDNHIDITINDKTYTYDKLLVSIGRKPNTDDIGLNNTKIKLSESNHILVNDFQQTEDSHIYAAGDCIGKLQLAHVWVQRRYNSY